LIFTFFLFIFCCNFISLTPFAVALSSQIIVIFLLTFTLCSAIFLQGIFLQGVFFLRIFVPESPLLLLFILVPIEIFSYGIRALSMAIRLSANILLAIL
jgi:F-type H+-transporting ATPase subunit a